MVRGIAGLHLGPIRGRKPGTWGLLEGYVANPAIEAEASKILCIHHSGMKEI